MADVPPPPSAKLTPGTPADLESRLPMILLAGWLVPGASHALIGKRTKGAFLCAVLLGTFIAGQALGDFRLVDYDRHPINFFGQAGMGLPFLVGLAATRSLPVVRTPPQQETLGLLYSSVAALLNLLCVLDAYERVVRLNLPNLDEAKDGKKRKGKGKGKKGKADEGDPA